MRTVTRPPKSCFLRVPIVPLLLLLTCHQYCQHALERFTSAFDDFAVGIYHAMAPQRDHAYTPDSDLIKQQF